jgi:hypothetical protein
MNFELQRIWNYNIFIDIIFLIIFKLNFFLQENNFFTCHNRSDFSL